MKKHNLLFSNVIILLVTIFGTLQASAQLTEDKVKSIMADEGWTFSGDSRYAYLKEKGYTTWWYRDFYADYEYAVVAFSEDEDVNDMDLAVQYQYGTSFKNDNSSRDFAFVSFSVPYTTRLRIKMTNYDSDTPNYASKCYYMIFYKKD